MEVKDFLTQKDCILTIKNKHAQQWWQGTGQGYTVSLHMRALLTDLPRGSEQTVQVLPLQKGQVDMLTTRFWSHGRASKFAFGLSLPLGFFPYQCYWTFFCVLVSSFTKWTDYLAFTLEEILRNNEVLWVLLSHTDTHTTGEERREIERLSVMEFKEK